MGGSCSEDNPYTIKLQLCIECINTMVNTLEIVHVLFNNPSFYQHNYNVPSCAFISHLTCFSYFSTINDNEPIIVGNKRNVSHLVYYVQPNSIQQRS